MKFSSLRQRFLILLLLPVALVFSCIIIVGFIYSRNLMLDSWRESALLSLERAAHSIDMRLENPTLFIEISSSFSSAGLNVPWEESLIPELKKQPGIKDVKLTWLESAKVSSQRSIMRGRGHMANQGRRPVMGMMVHRAQVTDVSLPSFDPKEKQRTVSLNFELKDEKKQTLGILKVVMLFDYLLQDLQGMSWWKSQSAGLLTDKGIILARTSGFMATHNRLTQDNGKLQKDLLKQIAHKKSGTLMGPGHPPDKVAGFFHLKRTPWVLVLIAPGEKVLSPIIQYRNYFILAGLACLVLIVGVIVGVTGSISKAVKKISKASEKVAQGEYQVNLKPKTSDEIGSLITNFNKMVQGLKEKDRISDTFGRYMDPEIARKLLDSSKASELGGEKRGVAILMTDIRGFTPLCENLPPEETIEMVNRYLSGLIEVLQKHGGIIVDFLGDAILAFFDPLDTPLKPVAHKAVCCALEMQKAALSINKANISQKLPELETGIGLHVGEVVVGNIGSKSRTKYGIVGAPVNMTHRLQGKASGGEVIISGPVYDLLHEELILERKFSAHLKGIAQDKEIYSVKGLLNCGEFQSKDDLIT